MTGKIVGLAVHSRTGVIEAEDGSRLAFAATAVLGDFDALQVGHRVSFDVDRARPHGAVTVLREPRTDQQTAEHAGVAPDLRFLGFRQEGNIRRCRFGAVARGLLLRDFVVSVDMTLMVKHRIGIQEIPALCLRKLEADLQGSAGDVKHCLDEADLEAFAAARAAAVKRKKPRQAPASRRGSPPPAPSAGRRFGSPGAALDHNRR